MSSLWADRDGRTVDDVIADALDVDFDPPTFEETFLTIGRCLEATAMRQVLAVLVGAFVVACVLFGAPAVCGAIWDALMACWRAWRGA